MLPPVTVIYNEPLPSVYDSTGEKEAELGVLGAVNAVTHALEEQGYFVSTLPLLPPFEKAMGPLSSIRDGVIFNLFEGFAGHPETETLVPAYLKEHGIVFTGCTAVALRLGLDKAAVKRRLHLAAIPTPGFQVLKPATVNGFWLSFPCIVKPSAEDASHGITSDSVVWNHQALERQVNKICSTYKCDALVEEFLDGREFNATVMGNGKNELVLPVSEIVYTLPPGKPRLLTYASKWEPESSDYKQTAVACPALVNEELQHAVAGTARRAFRETVRSGYARVDMRMDGSGCVNVIEVNPNPDISPDAGAARQTAAAGWSYSEFITNIVRLAMEINQYEYQGPSDDGSRQTCHHAYPQAHA